MDEHEQSTAGQGELRRVLRRSAQEVPREMKRFVSFNERTLLTSIANNATGVTVENIPVSHLFAAANALLKVLAQQEQASDVFALLDVVQAGFTVALDDFMPGVGEALHSLYQYYRWQANKEGE